MTLDCEDLFLFDAGAQRRCGFLSILDIQSVCYGAAFVSIQTYKGSPEQTSRQLVP